MYSHFLNCDWGTTNFRLRLVDVASGKIVAEASSGEGVANVGHASAHTDRAGQFQKVLQRHIADLSQTAATNLDQVPIVISGMASSSLGWRDLPYANLPMPIDGRELVLSRLQEVGQLPQPVYLISGLKSASDVMRGEETELVGLGSLHRDLLARLGSAWVLLPGTHCKHVLVQNESIIDFRTYMTGELYNLLSEKSSLKHPQSHYEPGIDWEAPEVVDAFRDGVHLSRETSLTSSLFQVRVQQLMAGLTGQASKALLSGQLIGSEVWSLQSRCSSDSQIVLCAGRKLNVPYRLALELAGLAGRTVEIPPHEVEQLSAAGQWHALKSYRQLSEEHGQAAHRPHHPSMTATSKTNLL